MAAAVIDKLCETTGCDKEAKLQCPTCIKLEIQGSFFCSQECFKGFWSEHKATHKTAKAKSASANVNGVSSSSSSSYNPWPGYSFTGKLRPYPQSEKRVVKASIARPDYADHKEGFPASERAARGSSVIKALNDTELEDMKIACRLGREVLDEGAAAIGVGVTTDEIDRIVHEACMERDCYPSPLNYYTFPKSCCTSVNEVICHGIPDARPLVNGDIVNLDVTVYHRGYHGDLNETFFVGQVDEESKKLVRVSWECLDAAIKMVKPGEKYRELGNAIQKHAQANGYSVVRSYCGHGIHNLFHTAPNVPHYAKNKAIGIMKPGHCFTIEPMINSGVYRDVTWPDNWTAVTTDGRRSAQFEQTLVVTDTGCDILTARKDKDGQPWFMDSL